MTIHFLSTIKTFLLLLGHFRVTFWVLWSNWLKLTDWLTIHPECTEIGTSMWRPSALLEAMGGLMCTNIYVQYALQIFIMNKMVILMAKLHRKKIFEYIICIFFVYWQTFVHDHWRPNFLGVCYWQCKTEMIYGNFLAVIETDKLKLTDWKTVTDCNRLA